jgi:hypothetical protein
MVHPTERLELTKAPPEAYQHEMSLGSYLLYGFHCPGPGDLRTRRPRGTKVVARAGLHASPPNSYSLDGPLPSLPLLDFSVVHSEFPKFSIVESIPLVILA